MKNLAFLFLLLPATASATLAEQCELKIDGKVLATQIQVRDRASPFPLHVTYAGRAFVFPEKRGNVYRNGQHGIEIHVSDSREQNTVKLQAVNGKDCTHAGHLGAMCYALRYAFISLAATPEHPRTELSATHGQLVFAQ